MLPLWTSVTLVAALVERVLDRPANEALGARHADRLDADARIFANRLTHFALEEVDQPAWLQDVPCSNSIPE